MAGEGAAESIITWNVPNWVTIVLMAAIGFGLLGLAQSWYKKRQAA
jgi:hypothetical protein